jgi:hypothetical protein
MRRCSRETAYAVALSDVEDEDPRAGVPREERTDRGALRGREGEERAALAERDEGPAPLLGPRRRLCEVEPVRAGSLSHERAEYRPVGRDGADPRGALVGVEVEVQRDEIERREVAPGQVPDGELEHRRADELLDPLGDRPRRRCRGEPEACRRGTELQELVADPRPEVMCLVNDQELEPVAQPVHVPPAALESRHRDRLDPPLTVTEAAHGTG